MKKMVGPHISNDELNILVFIYGRLSYKLRRFQGIKTSLKEALMASFNQLCALM